MATLLMAVLCEYPIIIEYLVVIFAFSALTLLVG